MLLDPDATTSEPGVPARREAVAYAAGIGGGELWEAPGLDGPAPLLVVHDGPAYAGEGRLLDYLTRLAAGRLADAPAVATRVLLLAPTDRDLQYAANDDYAAALARVVAEARDSCPTDAVVGVGASLGALAMLHATWRGAALDGLLLQSGSFFTPETDPQEREFGRFTEVTDFVAEVLEDNPPRPLPPIAMTCGADEENVLNNRLMAGRLRELADVTYAEAHAVHNFPAWRDALHPSLAGLLARAIAPTR